MGLSTLLYFIVLSNAFIPAVVEAAVFTATVQRHFTSQNGTIKNNNTTQSHTVKYVNVWEREKQKKCEKTQSMGFPFNFTKHTQRLPSTICTMYISMRYVCADWNPRNVWIIYCMRKFDKNSFSGEVSFEQIQNTYSPRFVSIVTTCAPFFKYTVFSVSLIFLVTFFLTNAFICFTLCIYLLSCIHSFVQFLSYREFPFIEIPLILSW